MHVKSLFLRILIIIIVALLISDAEAQYKPYFPKSSYVESLRSFLNAYNNSSAVESSVQNPPLNSQPLYPSSETTTESSVIPSDIFPPPSASVFSGTSSSASNGANSDSSSASYVPPSTRYVSSRETLISNKAPSDIFSPPNATVFAGTSSSASSSANTDSSSASYVPSSTRYVPSRASYLPSSNAESKESSVLPYAYASSIANYDSNLNSIRDTSDSVLPPIVETFSNSLSKAVLTIPIIQKFLNIEIPGSEAFTLFLNALNNILKDYGKQIPVLPKWIPQSNKGQGLLTLPLFFQATGNAITKFLISQGIKRVPDITDSAFVDNIEKVMKIANITNTETLYKTISEGYINLLKSLGINIGEHYDSIAELLQNEMKTVQNYY